MRAEPKRGGHVDTNMKALCPVLQRRAREGVAVVGKEGGRHETLGVLWKEHMYDCESKEDKSLVTHASEGVEAAVVGG